MAQALLLARIVLAAAVMVAGLAKLLDPSAASRLSEYAGLPQRARPAVRVMPVAELAVAACLLPARTSRPAATGARLVLVSRPPVVEEAELRAAAGVATRHVADRGALAARYGISPTPAALVLGRRGSLERVVLGAPGVQALLEPDAESEIGLDAQARGVISRRHLVAAGVALAAMLPRFSLPDGLRTRIGPSAAATGVTCPSCGSCVVCDAGAGSSALHCRACSQHCSGLKLCKSFANVFPPFKALAQHLRGLGFSQDGEVTTHGLARAGKLVVLPGSTSFASRSPSTPRAVLIYSLVESGQFAWAALLNARGAVRSVATVAGGRVVNGVIGGLAGLDNALGQTAFCEDYACKLLKFCCNYSGACNESDAQCEHDCPGGLAHPMAHCDAYLDGKRVSSLIVP
ncbi:MAG: DoxX family protein [Acidimicrobiales bacterium]